MYLDSSQFAQQHAFFGREIGEKLGHNLQFREKLTAVFSSINFTCSDLNKVSAERFPVQRNQFKHMTPFSLEQSSKNRIWTEFSISSGWKFLGTQNLPSRMKSNLAQLTSFYVTKTLSKRAGRVSLWTKLANLQLRYVMDELPLYWNQTQKIWLFSLEQTAPLWMQQRFFSWVKLSRRSVLSVVYFRQRVWWELWLGMNSN